MEWTTFGLVLALVPVSLLLLVAAAWLAARRARTRTARVLGGLGALLLLAAVLGLLWRQAGG